ncbi:hypothetical protein [Butyrivibrio sp. INlla18]|uniref:hypothetical protein n=1 Tax=Butyrivibrio sp. INlla18 TaxID=1520806 RepID=UPI000B865B9F|nr:hypothetical protein [Butyrivibrio sp. INlla18]
MMLDIVNNNKSFIYAKKKKGVTDRTFSIKELGIEGLGYRVNNCKQLSYDIDSRNVIKAFEKLLESVKDDILIQMIKKNWKPQLNL